MCRTPNVHLTYTSSCVRTRVRTHVNSRIKETLFSSVERIYEFYFLRLLLHWHFQIEHAKRWRRHCDVAARFQSLTHKKCLAVSCNTVQFFCARYEQPNPLYSWKDRTELLPTMHRISKIETRSVYDKRRWSDFWRVTIVWIWLWVGTRKLNVRINWRQNEVSADTVCTVIGFLLSERLLFKILSFSLFWNRLNCWK